MDTDDGWPKVWADMSDDELRDRLRQPRNQDWLRYLCCIIRRSDIQDRW